MSNEKELIEEISRLLAEAFSAHNRGEYYDCGIRMSVFDGKPLWKIMVVWRVEDDAPIVTIKQRKM